jgi:hypothetical protein
MKWREVIGILLVWVGIAAFITMVAISAYNHPTPYVPSDDNGLPEVITFE